MPAKLTSAIIDAAIEGFEARKRNIDIQIAELRLTLSSSPIAASTDEPAKLPRRKISAAGRRRMAAAQQKRWAAVKGPAAPAKKTSTPKRKLSAAGRAAIVAAMKKRWAGKKAAKN